ncbi:unnamed protein product [marine sediment metagenome]|uniref:Uncharacterized protein n=1 Tax=marine sediment metagenome TaxID=412755 RepID=X1TMC2_9ZZZZ
MRRPTGSSHGHIASRGGCEPTAPNSLVFDLKESCKMIEIIADAFTSVVALGSSD